jgi:hypothetical protein
MGSEDGPNGLSMPEERLLQHLYGLREDAPGPPALLAAAVIRSARWQAVVRPYVRAGAMLIGGMGESVRIMAGGTLR